MTPLLDVLPVAAITLQSAVYDYEYVGPGKNEVPWLDLFALAVCVLGVVVVVRGVLHGRRD